jgi:hypothetical protein
VNMLVESNAAGAKEISYRKLRITYMTPKIITKIIIIAGNLTKGKVR